MKIKRNLIEQMENRFDYIEPFRSRYEMEIYRMKEDVVKALKLYNENKFLASIPKLCCKKCGRLVHLRTKKGGKCQQCWFKEILGDIK